MLDLKTKKEQAQLASQMAHGLQLVSYQNVLYVPVDYETLTIGTLPTDDRRVWLPQTTDSLVKLANETQRILFANDGEKRSFITMVKQEATTVSTATESVLLVTDTNDLRELSNEGKLQPVTQNFCPYFIQTPLVTDKKLKQEMFDVLVSWFDNEDDVESLLAHLATVLAPHWSAVRYVLLIGEGRNGKSLLMKMLVDLFGQQNVSHVSRQEMSEKKPTCHSLTNKLMNVVFDGEASYLRDSGLEKTLTAGEVAEIKVLYETFPVPVQTNGLFIEGLNREPKTSDKSGALQKRMIRFYLPNTFELDHNFERHMRSPKMLGALLALLVDRYVQHNEVTEKLRPTETSIQLKLEQMHVNSLAFQFFEYLDVHDPLGVDGLIGELMPDVARKFITWRDTENNNRDSWNPADVVAMLRPLLHTERKSTRINGKVMKVRVINGIQQDVQEFIEYMRGEDPADAAILDTLVEDRPLHVESADTTG